MVGDDGGDDSSRDAPAVPPSDERSVLEPPLPESSSPLPSDDGASSSPSASADAPSSASPSDRSARGGRDDNEEEEDSAKKASDEEASDPKNVSVVDVGGVVDEGGGGGAAASAEADADSSPPPPLESSSDPRSREGRDAEGGKKSDVEVYRPGTMCTPTASSENNSDQHENGHRAAGRLKPVLLLDPRAAALFRVAIALCALNELRLAFLSRDAFLTDDGMLPRAKHLTMYKENRNLYQTHGVNLWLAVSASETVMILLVVQLLYTVGLLVGYYTRLSSGVVFAFINSWNLRLANKQADGLGVISIMLLWGFMLPLGDMYSIDALIRAQKSAKKESNGSTCSSGVAMMANSLFSLRDHILSLGIPLHFAVLYYSCGAEKDTEHWRTGNAFIMTVNKGNEANEPFASMLGSFPLLCWVLTHTTFYIEKYCGFLLLVPSQTLRVALLALLIPFHFLIHLALDSGMFQPSMMSGLLLLTPTQGCDFLEARLRSSCSRILSMCAGSQEQGVAMLRSGKQAAKTLGACLAALLGVTMALGVTFVTTNDLCSSLSERTRGKHTCWRYGSDRTNLPINRLLAFMGTPQHHTPFQVIHPKRSYWHIVGIVEGNTTVDAGDSCISEHGEKAVALFTDENGSQLNFDERLLWSLDKEPHLNQRWSKFFDQPFHYPRDFPELAGHICRKWNRRAGYPRLNSVTTLHVWQDMSFPDGSLVLSPRRCSHLSHFECTITGQSENLCDIVPKIDEIMDKHKMVRFQEITVKNTEHLTMRVYWVNSETGMEIPKGSIRAESQWQQIAEFGHTFKFYWDVPGAKENFGDWRGLLAGEYKVGSCDEKFTPSNSKLDTEFVVKNNSRHPLVAYWVYPRTGQEIKKKSIGKNSNWFQTGKLGHTFRFYWDLPDAPKGAANKRLLAKEHTLHTYNEEVVIVENLGPE